MNINTRLNNMKNIEIKPELLINYIHAFYGITVTSELAERAAQGLAGSLQAICQPPQERPVSAPSEGAGRG